MKLFKWTCGAILLAFLLLVLSSFYVTEQMMRPGFYELRTPAQGLLPRDGLVDPKQSFGLTFENVEFPAVDGKTLRGWFIPTDEDSVVIIAAHGGGSDRRSFLSFAPTLHEAGYPVLLFDNREHGISDGIGLGMSLGMRESEDIVSAVDFLESRGFSSFGTIGSSQGATSAILAAANDQRIALVVAQGTGTDLEDMMEANPALSRAPRWLLSAFAMHYYYRQGAPWSVIRQGGVWPIDVIHEIAPRPLLLIQGENDEMAPLPLARQIFEAAGEPKSLWVVEGAGHRGLRQSAGGECERRVVEFLRAHLPLDE